MIIDTLLGNIHDAHEHGHGHTHAHTDADGHDHAHGSFAGATVVPITLHDADRRKRVQRLVAADGTEIGIKLPAGHEPLRDGDVVHTDGSTIYVIAVDATDVLVIHPRDVHEMGVVAHTLGNRHMPAQFAGGDMIVQFDHTIVDYLEARGVAYTREQRVMPHPFRHAEHTH